MTLIWNIIQSVITILEIRVCVWMMEKFAEPRYSGKKQKIVVWIVTLGVGVAYAVNRWITSYYSRIEIVTVFILLCLIAMWIFRYYREIAVLIAANYLLIGGLIDLVSMSAIELLSHDTGMFVHILKVNDKYRMMALVISKAFLFVICRIVYKRSDKIIIHHLMNNSIIKISVILCAAEYIAIHVLTEILNYNNGITQEFLLSSVFYLIVIFLLLVILIIVILYDDTKAQLKLKDIYLESMDAENKRVIKLYREREKMYHDFKNHLLVLEGFLQSGDIEQYQVYMEQIRKPFLQKPGECRSGHSIIDLIVNYKVWEARQQDIQVNCKVFGYINFQLQMANEDACSLMGNLWDNAIEACAKLPIEKRWIDFTLQIRPEKILLEIKNPVLEFPDQVDGKLRTTKKNKQYHGVGTRTIKNITEQYNGYFNYVIYDHIFEVEVMICNK